jgi:uncharacterized repeat protein (TIGR01451 family)
MRDAMSIGSCVRAAAIGAAIAVSLLDAPLTRPAFAARGFDIDLDDRVDPVRPGEEIVYEIGIENSFETPAPDTIVTDFLPPGTTYVAAYRQPDYAEIPAEVDSGVVRWHLGDEPSCGNVGLPPCRDIWAVLRVDDDVAPGTVLMNHVEMTSSDPVNYPTHQDTTYTSVGSAAIRNAKVTFPRTPGRDRITVRADLARSGLQTPSSPPPPTLDPSAGVHIMLREPGQAPVLDIDVPGSALRCSGTVARHCQLDDPSLYRPLGLDRLTIFLPFLLQQRNNAQVLVRTASLTLPDDFGPDLELTIDSGGVTYVDDATLRAAPNRLTYLHTQAEP